VDYRIRNENLWSVLWADHMRPEPARDKPETKRTNQHKPYLILCAYCGTFVLAFRPLFSSNLCLIPFLSFVAYTHARTKNLSFFKIYVKISSKKSSISSTKNVISPKKRPKWALPFFTLKRFRLLCIVGGGKAPKDKERGFLFS
jgi:hypothetical protein